MWRKYFSFFQKWAVYHHIQLDFAPQHTVRCQCLCPYVPSTSCPHLWCTTCTSGNICSHSCPENVYQPLQWLVVAKRGPFSVTIKIFLESLALTLKVRILPNSVFVSSCYVSVHVGATSLSAIARVLSIISRRESSPPPGAFCWASKAIMITFRQLEFHRVFAVITWVDDRSAGYQNTCVFSMCGQLTPQLDHRRAFLWTCVPWLLFKQPICKILNKFSPLN